jgi:hypothetical protein
MPLAPNSALGGVTRLAVHPLAALTVDFPVKRPE